MAADGWENGDPFCSPRAVDNLYAHFVAGLEDVRGKATESLAAVRVLDEATMEVERRMAATWRRLETAVAAASGGGADVSSVEESVARLTGLEALAHDACDIRVALLDNCYTALDVAVHDLDRRIALGERLVALQAERTARTAAGESAAGGRGDGTERGEDGPAAARRKRVVACDDDDEGAGLTDGLAALVAAALSGNASRRGADGVGSTASHATRAGDATTTGAGSGNGAGDAVIDPSEPVYCYCRQVAFGDMVACDNPDCPVEWYHCQCVGITRANMPKSWMCKECTAQGYGVKAPAPAPTMR